MLPSYPRVTFISSATRYTWNLSEVKATMHSLESPSTEIPSMVAIPALDILIIIAAHRTRCSLLTTD